MGIAAGKLRHRVQVQEQVPTQDPNTGDVTTTWQNVGDRVWASVEPLSVRDFIQSGAEQSEVSARITLRYRQLKASMRILHGATIYNIAGVLPDADSGIEYMTIPVSTGVNEGE